MATGKKRTLKEMSEGSDDDKTEVDDVAAEPVPQKRKLFVGMARIQGIAKEDEWDAVNRLIEESTERLSNDTDAKKSQFVVVFNIHSVIEKCDILDLVKSVAFPLHLHYFQCPVGRAWMEFSDHETALKVVDKFNGCELEDKKLCVGLIEKHVPYLNLFATNKEYHRLKRVSLASGPQGNRRWIPPKNKKGSKGSNATGNDQSAITENTIMVD